MADMQCVVHSTTSPEPMPNIITQQLPQGLQKLIEKCHLLYPDQLNPMQVTTVLKYWLGGQDPLDYISMYYNPGKPELNIEPHWHYISFGLSDLHGDGRVHLPGTRVNNGESTSGMGFELTFRLYKSRSTTVDVGVPFKPPTWPANLLQSLARYVFATGNRLCAGDNVPWRKSLDNGTSKIEHMLIATDPQLSRMHTSNGTVDFCQIVGVTEEELEQASRWNGNGIMNLLKADPATGGEWLITNMSRSLSVFELFPETLQQLERDLENEGSNLAGVNAEFSYKELPPLTKVKIELGIQDDTQDSTIETTTLVGTFASQLNVPIKKEKDEDDSKLNLTSLSNSLNMYCSSSYKSETMSDTSKIVPLDGLHLTLAPDAARFLVLAIRDRIRHGRHFTFKCKNLAVTFVSESVTGSVVSKQVPYGIMGYWMQVLITDDLIPKMIEAFRELALPTAPENLLQFPRTYDFPEHNLKIVLAYPEVHPQSTTMLAPSE